jgi:ATP-dependent Zn protease
METRKIMERCFNVALDNIQQHRKFIEEAVVLLIEQETLDESNLKDLWSSNIKFSPN